MTATFGNAAEAASDEPPRLTSNNEQRAALGHRTRLAYAAPLGPKVATASARADVTAQTAPNATRFVFDPLGAQPQYHPANVPLPETRTLEDHLLTGVVALMLVAYQLRRKHKFLRPHRFSA